MATTTIPWGDGSGDNIYLTYSASQGDQTVLVSSDANGGPARTKDITFVSTVGNISRVLTVLQESGMDLVSITWNDVCITYDDTAIGYPYVEPYIVFADPVVEQICATNWGDGTGIKPSQAAQVTSFGTTFTGNTLITSFNEQSYFTGLTSYGSSNPGTFNACTALVSVTVPYIPNPDTQTFERAYQNCSSLEIVTLHAEIRDRNGTAGPSYTFHGCTNLTRVNIDSVEKWMKNFWNRYAHPFNASPGGHLYLDGIEITNVVIPSTISAINPRAFWKCIGITSVIIPSSVTSVGINSFQNCTSLVNIEIGSSCGTIGSEAFSNVGTTTNKCTFVLRPVTPPTLTNTNAFPANRINKIYVPNGTLSAYQSATNWSSFASYMAELDANGNIPT